MACCSLLRVRSTPSNRTRCLRNQLRTTSHQYFENEISTCNFKPSCAPSPSPAPADRFEFVRGMLATPSSPSKGCKQGGSCNRLGDRDPTTTPSRSSSSSSSNNNNNSSSSDGPRPRQEFNLANIIPLSRNRIGRTTGHNGMSNVLI